MVIPSTSAVRFVGSTPRTPSNAATSRPGVATSVRVRNRLEVFFASRTGLLGRNRRILPLQPLDKLLVSRVGACLNHVRQLRAFHALTMR